MRITVLDLCTEDLTWFGIDSFGRVFSCFSGVNGNVPEFVCRSREETDILEEYFTEQAEKICEAIFRLNRQNCWYRRRENDLILFLERK